jgi:IS605 OrfB family transposase
VGAAGPPDPLPGRAGPRRHPAGRGRAAVAGGHRRRPGPTARPGPRQGRRGGSRHHPPLRGHHPGRRPAGVGQGGAGRGLAASARPASPPGQSGPAGTQAGQRGSRRWRRHRAKLRRVEAQHRRRVHQAHHQAANQVVAFAVQQRVGTLLVGDLNGIEEQDAGRVQNLRLRQWRRTHLLGALRDKAERAGIVVRLVDERGSSSTCPVCHRRVPKPKGRRFRCPHCGLHGHRDLVGAHNIAAKAGGGRTSTDIAVLVEHRRAGIVPARRDRRRHLHDRRRRRSCPAPGHTAAAAVAVGCRSSAAGSSPAAGEDQAALPNRANVA